MSERACVYLQWDGPRVDQSIAVTEHAGHAVATRPGPGNIEPDRMAEGGEGGQEPDRKTSTEKETGE